MFKDKKMLDDVIGAQVDAFTGKHPNVTSLIFMPAVTRTRALEFYRFSMLSYGLSLLTNAAIKHLPKATYMPQVTAH